MRIDKQTQADYNRARVFHLISKEAPINRSEIAKQLGLSIPTIMKIVDDFMNEGIINENGKGESTGGTRPILYEITKDAYYCIGLDIGRSKINIILTNLKGEIIYNKVKAVNDFSEPDEIIELMIAGIEQALYKTHIPLNNIMGIGIGMPGIIHSASGIIVYSPNFNWKNIDLITPLQEKYGLPVMIENSNRTMALGEQWFGIGKNSDIILCINLGQGIGAAILNRDVIYYGGSGTSGELGHMILEKEGPLCECGNFGCLQALASGNAIAKKLNKKEAKEVFDLAKEGDLQAGKVISEAVEYIGMGIANAINILDPELVILSGGIMKSSDYFWEDLLSNIYNHRMKYTGRNVKIKSSSLGENATALGAVVLLLKQFRNNGAHIKK